MHNANTMSRWITIVLLAFSLCLPFGVSAKGIPKGYPSNFDHNGVIGKIDVRSGMIVIQDTQFDIPTNLKVTTPRGKNHSIHSLRAGQRVGVMLDRSQPRRPMVTQLWVLPRSHPGIAPPN